jgi:hypothetical protein
MYFLILKQILVNRKITLLICYKLYKSNRIYLSNKTFNNKIAS